MADEIKADGTCDEAESGPAAGAIYERDGDVFVPSRWAGSPWSRDLQHGAPVIGLFTREAERAADETGLQLVRLTVDLFRPVPLEPAVVSCRFTRRGRRIAALEISLYRVGEEAPVSRASALLLRPAGAREPSWQTPESPLPPPDQVVGKPPSLSGAMRASMPPGFHLSIESRAGADEVGPFVWMTTPLDLVAGEPITALQRATALTDMTLGSQMRIAAAQGEARPVFMINADTTVYWERPFVGAWLGIRGALVTEREGIGVAEAILYDSAGRVGRSLQGALLQEMQR